VEKPVGTVCIALAWQGGTWSQRFQLGERSRGWIKEMTAGRGWIALALVVFASWMPWRVALGAYLFGAITILQFHGQAWGLGIPAQFMTALPYLATIVVLVIISGERARARANTPLCLAKPFVAER
jgi:general nucleoside transport system permease protein